ncbi:MAG: 2-succinyl-5-enolpyruvyl-6-hydroxy-3-cyclohexene-1-carboxylic-acid synthase [Microcoleaceae cyanobacterium]
MIDFRNLNTVWASVLVETLYRLGLKTAIICPGSRSTPLTVAFVQHSAVETIPILDERSAAFFALGVAKRSGLPTVLVCTSGTAGANFYPAVIEAKESRVPLIILTADRPAELRNSHAGQTIDQVKLYGDFPNWYTELSLPSIDLELLNYLRQTIIYSWEKSLIPIKGVVHLNLPFRDPLHPAEQIESEQLKTNFPNNFFDHIRPLESYSSIPSSIQSNLKQWQQIEKGIIIAGVAQPHNSPNYCTAIAQLAQQLNWPVLAEGLSPLRNFSNYNSFIISTYDSFLRNPKTAQKLTPEIVILIGDLPTSKVLRRWLKSLQTETIVIDETYQNLDALHSRTVHLRISIEQIGEFLKTETSNNNTNLKSLYLQYWLDLEQQTQQYINQEMKQIEQLIEPKIAWLLPQYLSSNTSIFIANSMPVRDVESFWRVNSAEIQPFFNRGANGIDGTLSTALGMAHHHQNNVLLTGDLALLHDTNGGLIGSKFKGNLTIILINNNGGGIFEMLPISQFEPPFEEFFATPQSINFADWCRTYQIEYELIQSWEQLENQISCLHHLGIRLLEIRTNRKEDTAWRKLFFEQFSRTLNHKQTKGEFK